MMILALTLTLMGQLSDNTITAITRGENATLFGSRDGVFALYDSGESRMIPGISGQVTAIASPYVATTKGVFRLENGAAVQIRGADLFVSSLAVGARAYIGGEFGVAELNPTGATKKLTDSEATAIVFSGDTLVVATRDGLYSFSDSWIPLGKAIIYSQVVVLGQRWLGLRPDGVIDLGTMDKSPLFTSLEFPFSDDPVTALSALSDAKFVVGTWRGRILIGEIPSFGRPKFKMIRDPQAASHAILALSSTGRIPGAPIIYAGTDGGGIIELTVSDDLNLIAERIITAQRPAAPEILRPESHEPVPPGPNRKKIILYASLGFIGLLLVLLIFRIKANRRSRQMKERRRNSREPFELPEIKDLSSDIAAYARRFHEVTNHVNEMTREIATETSPDFAARTGQVLSEFQTIESWMKARLANIRKEREAKSGELARIRNALRSGGAEHSQEELEKTLTEIEEWLQVTHRDERYLKYVLEE